MTLTLTHNISALFRVRNHFSLLAPIFSLNRNTHTLLPNTVAFMASADVDAKSGFTRPEMYKENLAGTVEAYDRHVFVCYKNHHSWPARLEASKDDPFLKGVGSAFKARKKELSKTKITVCESREDAGLSDGDVLLFPEMIKYRRLNESNADSFFDDVLLGGKPWTAGVQDGLTGSHIFVCAHGSRDVRCGVCGPVLIEKLNEEIELRGLKEQISVLACSHVGGHKYAGNVIVFSPGPDEKITGHWYGYVTPNDVPALLDQHIAKGMVIQKLWRGQMGPATQVANGGDTDTVKQNNVESNNLSSNVNVGGCCQGVNGVSCCQTANFEQNKGIEETTGAHKKQGSETCLKWPALQQHNIITAAGVLGALAAIAVAYRFYRRCSTLITKCSKKKKRVILYGIMT
nr:uncharacterized protein LOC112801929 isoform X2 [Arachis hypogaea]